MDFLKGKINVKHDDKDSFVIYMCVEGSATFSYQNQTETLTMGETILIPTSLKNIEISVENQSEFLEVYIK
ncbi:hypothetical protein [Polaribacter sp.]|uniref:hypothetical protein n=1 Tax=Polaribacter sp. TaxID=1920175 RepID=UPI00404854B0